MFLTALPLLLLGCADDGLLDESFLDRQRILAASVDVGGSSEVMAGEVATIDVLTWSPDPDPQTMVVVCIPDPEEPDAACPTDELLRDAKEQDFTTEEGAAWATGQGVLGVLPSLSVAISVQAGMGIPADDNRSYLPLGLAAWTEGRDDDERARLTAVVVEDGEDRNANPTPPRLAIDGETVTGSLIEVDAGSAVIVTAEEVEPPETWTGVEGETYTETFTYRWYSDLGDLMATGLDIPLGASDVQEEREWILPEAESDGSLYLVVRDGRGGMAWSSYSVEVR